MKLKLDYLDLKEDPGTQLAFRKVYKKSGSLIDLDHPMSLEWAELHEARKRLLDESEDLLLRAQNDGRDLNEDEETAFNVSKIILDEIEKDFSRREASGDRSAKDPNSIERKMYFPPKTDKRISGMEYTNGTGKEWRSLFPTRDTYGEEYRNDFAKFFMSVARRDPSLRQVEPETRANVEGTGIFGGFLVPDVISEILMDKALLCGEVFRPRCLVLPMTSASVQAPKFSSMDRSDGTLFGLELKFYGEAEEMDTQRAKIDMQALYARKAGILWQESLELMADAPSFDARLKAMLPKVVAAGLDRYFFKGTGAGQPLGLINSNSTKTVTRDTAGDIVYNDIMNLWSALHPSCYADAVWICNPKAIPKLLALKDSSNNSIWQPGTSGSIQNGVPVSLYGKEVLFLECASAIGSSGDIALASLSNYCIGLRQGIAVEASSGPGFTKALMTFRLLMRFDGQPIWSDPITMENGETASWASILS